MKRAMHWVLLVLFSGLLSSSAAAQARSALVRVDGVRHATDVAAGAADTCAIVEGGRVRCWGAHYSPSERGRSGGETWRCVSVAVRGLTGAAQIDVGTLPGEPEDGSLPTPQSRGCARLDDNTVSCWTGQEPPGNATPRATPVEGLSDVIEVSVGGAHVCALLMDATVRCWGANDRGQLGDGTTENRVSPVAVAGLRNVIAVSAGARHTCARVSGGSVSCWGSDSHGQVTGAAREDPDATQPTPAAVPGVTDVARLALGEVSTCAALAGGDVSCWGGNGSTQLGHPRTSAVRAPGNVPGVQSAREVSAADAYACARLDDGSVSCWGSFDEEGRGSHPGGGPDGAPAPIPGLTRAEDITTGSQHSCVRRGEHVLCWGRRHRCNLGSGQQQRVRRPAAGR